MGLGCLAYPASRPVCEVCKGDRLDDDGKSLKSGRDIEVLMNVEFRGVEAADDAGLCASILFLGFENTVDTGRLLGVLPRPTLP